MTSFPRHRLPRRLIALGLFLLLAAPLPGTAQTAGGAPASGFPVGQPAAPKVGQPYVRDSFGKWQIRCVKAPEGQTDPCLMVQVITDGKGAPVAEFRIQPLEGNGPAVAGVEVVTPLGTLLTENVILTIDGSTPKQYPFLWCDRGGCIARIGLTKEELEKLRKGKRAVITIRSIANPQQPIPLLLPLEGFTDAWKGLAGATAQARKDKDGKTGQ